MMTPFLRTLPPLLSALMLSACAGFMPPQQVAVDVAPQWHAPLPHGGTVSSLTDWWKNQGDPVLVELIAAAQSASPSVSQAATRITQARASQVAARSEFSPQLGAQYGASRGVALPTGPVTTSQQIGLQASWEVDLIGKGRALGSASDAQLENSRAQWHDARVSVAAEVARLYYGLGTCQQLLALSQRDAASRTETSRLTEITTKAGFLAPAMAAMARASAADSNARATQQAAQCDLQVKALVALTALPEPNLRQKLALALAKPAQAATISIASIPAQTITQRPDVFTAERGVLLASVEVGVAKGQRLPRLTLNGTIAGARVNTGGADAEGTTWSFGPVALTLPIFDSGLRRANVDSANAAYDTAIVNYQSTVRQAVREVEEALVTLNSTQARSADAQLATQGYAESLAGTQARYGQGFANLVELEDARRNAWVAESNLLALQLERQQAWVALYRALGGGFEPRLAQNDAP
jgi:multidrug efflux system outer membrane protein